MVFPPSCSPGRWRQDYRQHPITWVDCSDDFTSSCVGVWGLFEPWVGGVVHSCCLLRFLEEQAQKEFPRESRSGQEKMDACSCLVVILCMVKKRKM